MYTISINLNLRQRQVCANMSIVVQHTIDGTVGILWVHYVSKSMSTDLSEKPNSMVYANFTLYLLRKIVIL